MDQLSQESGIVNWMGPTATGQGDVVPATRIDMRGFDRLTILIRVGAIAAGGIVAAFLRHAATDVAGVKTTLTKALGAADDNELIVLEVRDPVLRFLDLVIERTVGDSDIVSILALQHRASGPMPIAQAAGINVASAVRPATA